MNTIRPLITITLLAAAGIFLYVQINKAPVRPLPGDGDAALLPASDGVPPLDNTAGAATTKTTGGGPSTGSTLAPLAPQWPSTTSANTPSPGGASGTTQSHVPAIPDLPELPTSPAFADASPTAPPVTPPIDNPGNRYTIAPPAAGTDAPPLGAANNTPGVTSAEAPTAAATSNNANANATPPTTSTSTVETEHDSAAESAMAAMGLTPSPNATPATPAPSGDSRYGTPPVAANSPADNRYGMASGDAGPSATNAAAGSPAADPSRNPLSTAAAPTQSFAASWPAIQSALQKSELARGHQLLSPWHNNPSLTAAESQQVDALLGQLAGTVIYSTEHRLEPPYTVRPGDTLETIAKQLDVPWQLLAKINGVPAASPLQPGQQLKVVRGPFKAELDLNRNQLVLEVDGRYAGKFAVSASPEASLPPGDWVVLAKPTTPAPQASVYGTAPSANPTVTRSIILRSASATPANPGMPIQIGAAPTADAAGAANGLRPEGGDASPYLVKVSPSDAEELSDILSIGSRVVIRR